MRYGTERETTTIDQNGSTITKEVHFVDYQPTSPIRKYFAIREKVTSKKDELSEYLKFSDSLDDTKLDPEFKIDRPRNVTGYYYVVKCWTELIR